MKHRPKNITKCRARYLDLIYEITKYKLSGKHPPAELLEKARKAAIKASISREQLENI